MNFEEKDCEIIPRSLFRPNMPKHKMNKNRGFRNRGLQKRNMPSSVQGKATAPTAGAFHEMVRYGQCKDLWFYPIKARIYQCTLSVPAAVLLSPGSTPQYQGISFQASSFPAFANLASAFDRYRMDFICVEMWTDFGTGVVAPGQLYSVIDYDDANALTTASAICQPETCVCTSLVDEQVRAWKPRIALGAYAGSFTSYANMKSQWIDCASQGVQHYGLKVLSTATSATGLIINFSYKANFSFTNEI